MSPPIHCMQGRLVPPQGARLQAFPRGAWKQELALAARAEVSGIEWIFEPYGESENPLGSEVGLSTLAAAQREHGTDVESLCADWFMDRPLLLGSRRDREEHEEKLHWLIGQAGRAGIRRMVLPFVDDVALEPRDEPALVALVEQAIPSLEGAGVELHLETSLAPGAFAALLARMDHPCVRANYDIGNSASLGYDAREEFAAYGERIGSVHVKDRLLGGDSVPLGAGNGNLGLVCRLLRALGWDRPLVLQVARGPTGQRGGYGASRGSRRAGHVG